SQLSPNIARLADELKKICKLTDFSKIPSLDTVLTPPVTKWNPAGSGTTSTTQNPQTQQWNPSGGTATNQPQNPQPQTWNPVGSGTTSQPQNPQTQQWNPSGGTATNQSKNPQPQTWNPTASNSTNPNINTSQTSLTQQTQKGSYPVVVKTIAVISTVIATSLGGFCYYQYQQINQVKQQIEKIRLDKKLLPPKGNKPSLSVELQNMMNVVQGKESFLYQDIEQLVSRIESQKSDLEKDINNWKSRVNKLEGENGSLQEKRDQLQSKVNEFEKETYVSFCNKTPSKTIAAAFAYWDGKGLTSRGWWVVDPGKCQEVNLEQNYRGTLYVHGTYNRGESNWGSGKYSFCVDIINSFKIPNSDKASCSGGSLRQVTMSELAVSPGTNNWDFNDEDSTGTSF
ncbi:MAG: DUF1036 domain-containing protein, partial [Microcoleus sp.]